jgi:hypothetical protein
MSAVSAFDGRLALARFVTAVVVAVLAASTALALTPRPAQAEGPITVITVIKLPSVLLDNRCNGDPVGLGYGQLTIATTIVPLSTGGEQVQGTITYSENLRGEDLITHEPYRGAEGEMSFSHYLPAGGGTYHDLAWSALLPQSHGPAMLLVESTRATLNSDFSLSEEIVQTHVACRYV